MKTFIQCFVSAMMFLFASLSFAQSALTAPDQAQNQTCKGSGADRECLYCVSTDGAKSCGWVKVPEPPKPAGNAPSTPNRVATLPPAQKQTCKGSGDSRECLYCVTTDGAKSCGWVKVPEPKGNTGGNRPAAPATFKAQ